MAKLNGVKGFNYKRLAQFIDDPGYYEDLDAKIDKLVHAEGLPVEDWTSAMSSFSAWVLKNAEKMQLSPDETFAYGKAVLDMMLSNLTDEFMNPR